MRRITQSLTVKIAMIMFCGLCLLSIISLQFRNNDLKNDIAEMQIKVDEAYIDLDELRREVNAPFDEEYIIKQAKKLNYHLPSEIIFYSDK